MRIGIDARFLTHPQRGGFKTYTENLIRAIAKIDKVNQYILYVDRKPKKNTLPNQANFDIRIVSGHFPLIGMPFREQILLPRQAQEDRVELFHFLCNTASINLPGKNVITLHDTIQVSNVESNKFTCKPHWYKNWLITQYSRKTILKKAGKADQIITVSEYEKSIISSVLNIPLEHISVSHLAPSPFFKPFEEEDHCILRVDIANKFNIHKRYILGLGYEPRKNISLLIDAFSRISQNQPDLDLVVICADEDYQLFFIELAEINQVGDRVIIISSLAAEELANLYNLAEVFVYPSERESFGLPPLEAIACGAPTIAMHASSLPEILQDGAFWVSDKNPQTWADAIQNVLTNRELRADLITRGLQQASQFSWEKCAQETIQVYQQVYEERRNSNDG